MMMCQTVVLYFEELITHYFGRNRRQQLTSKDEEKNFTQLRAQTKLTSQMILHIAFHIITISDETISICL